MRSITHKIYISTLITIVTAITAVLLWKGIPYYQTSLEERFFHPDHDLFKPSGLLGHGLGIFGSLLMLIGVVSYMARKRYKMLSRLGQIKHWLEFHIFLCTLGPIMVLFHTAFKFGGLVSVSFWSMVAVVASGVIGRFIYIQIPRTIEGRELSLQEVRQLRDDVSSQVNQSMQTPNQFQLAYQGGEPNMEGANSLSRAFNQYTHRRTILRDLNQQLRQRNVDRRERKNIIALAKQELKLGQRIGRLLFMQKIFRYWHVAHLPFAIVMLVIMLIHVAVTLAFGNFWIF